MVVNKRKKNTRMRAKTTHGYGSKKKHRGAGSRGGRGRAGSGKRGDVKKPSLTWKKGHKHKGSVGFKNYNKENIISINLNLLDQKIESFVLLGKATKQGDIYFVDFTQNKNSNFNFNKLLGAGSVKNKYEIKIKYASQIAIDKIEKAKGKVVLLTKEETKEETKNVDGANKNLAQKQKVNKEDVNKEKSKENKTKLTDVKKTTKEADASKN
jgi:large subunit ribosomal protein L15